MHETQKLQDRPNNQEHTNRMLAAFRTKFTEIDHGQARPSGKREYYLPSRLMQPGSYLTKY